MIIRLPWWFSGAMALSPRIMVVRTTVPGWLKVREPALRRKPAWLEQSDIEHEGVHQDQMRRLPRPRTLRFHLRWLRNAVARAAWEAEAFARDVVNFRAHFGGDLEAWVKAFAKNLATEKAYTRWGGTMPDLAECERLIRDAVEARNPER